MQSTQLALGNDVPRIFEYVRTKIRHDAYQGVLRGGTGTLLADAGNSLDKSILLHELLERAGYRSRYAHGTLDAVAAARLAQAIFVREGERSQSAEPVGSLAKTFVQSLIAEAVRQYRVVMRALAEGGFELSRQPLSAQPDVAEALRDHYWVQYLAGDKWIDLDPSFHDAQVGDTFARPQETLDTLPEKLFHRIVIRVVLEEQKEDQRVKRTLLTYAAAAAELSGRSLMLTHVPASWQQPLPYSGLTGTLGTTLGAISTPTYEDRAKPVLARETDYVVGEPFDIRHPHNETAGGPGGISGLGGLNQALSENKDMTTGEWIEFEFLGPDGSVEKTERTIFDRVGVAARRKGTMGQVPPGPLGMEHPLRSLFCLSFYTGPLMNVGVFSKDARAERIPEVHGAGNVSAVDVGTVLMRINHLFSLLADYLVSPLVADGQEVFYTWSAPRLIISTFRASPPSATFSIDLRRSGYHAVTPSGVPAPRSFQLQIFKGVLDGVIEGQIMDLIFAAHPGGGKVTPASYSTSRVFRQSAQQGIQIKLLQQTQGVAGLGLPEEPAVRIADAIAQGNFVVVPGRLVSLEGISRTSWWQISRSTGKTVGVTQDGLHQGSAEYEYVVVEHRTTPFAARSYYVYNIGPGGELVPSYLWNTTYELVAHILKKSLIIVVGLN